MLCELFIEVIYKLWKRNYIYHNGFLLQVYHFSAWRADPCWHRWIPILLEKPAENREHLHLQKAKADHEIDDSGKRKKKIKRIDESILRDHLRNFANLEISNYMYKLVPLLVIQLMPNLKYRIYSFHIIYFNYYYRLHIQLMFIKYRIYYLVSKMYPNSKWTLHI